MSALQMSEPFVSVAICTRNRPDTIGQAVASVLANEYAAFDLTVIDQSTTDATEMAVRPLVEADSRLHYLRVGEPGLSRAYNTAIRRSTGDILAFTDDDCVVPPDWLRAVVRAFAADDEADLLYGQVLPPPNAHEQPGPAPVLLIEQAQRLSRRDGFRIIGMGANFAARRRLFATIGGFDEVLGGGGPLRSSQDFDLAYRAYCAGRAILLRPEIQVVHYGARAGDEWPALLRAYGIGDGAFYFKHVRCRDAFALWLLIRQLASMGGRGVAKRLLRRGDELTYVRSFFEGIRQGLQFDIDCRARLYVQR